MVGAAAPWAAVAGGEKEEEEEEGDRGGGGGRVLKVRREFRVCLVGVYMYVCSVVIRENSY